MDLTKEEILLIENFRKASAAAQARILELARRSTLTPAQALAETVVAQRAAADRLAARPDVAAALASVDAVTRKVLVEK